MGQREVIERYRAKRFTDEEWEQIRPDYDETVDEAARGLPPRLEQHVQDWQLAWELPASRKLEQMAQAVASDKVLLLNLQFLGRSEFPQFSTLAEAHAWLKANSLDSEWAQRLAGEESSTLPEIRPVYLSPSDAEPWNPSVQVPHFDLSAPVLPWEVEYLVADPLLLKLAWASYRAAGFSGCWSLGQATAFLLTGQVPQLPRVRLWTSKLPGGGLRSAVEVYDALTLDEMKTLHKKMRQEADVYRRRRLSARDLEMVEFVESFGPLDFGSRKRVGWKAMLKRWNEQHANDREQFSHPSSLVNAYRRAKERMK